MIVIASTGYIKCLSKLKNKAVEANSVKAYKNTLAAKTIADIRGLKKMTGYKNAYRIKIGDFRIGVYIEANTVIFDKVAHRKDIYNEFP